MKEFDLEKAKAGHPVCTRDGRPVRILCFDRRSEDKSRPIIALVEEEPGNEVVRVYKQNGLFLDVLIDENDLMMAGVKKEGWGYVWLDDDGNPLVCGVFNSKKEAKVAVEIDGFQEQFVAVAKIEWEED